MTDYGIGQFTNRAHHARRAYQHICIIGDILSNNIKESGMYVMPEGRNADAALHRDTDIGYTDPWYKISDPWKMDMSGSSNYIISLPA
jgi:hypothetical protein